MRRCGNIPYTLCFDAPLFMLCDVFADKYQHVFNTFSHLFKAMQQQAITGCLLGTAVGGALGLPYEGLTPRRVHRLFNDLERYHFVFGRGMVSDDTEHACFVAQGLLASGGDTDTVGAIFGGIVGAGVGRDGIPAEWLRHLAEWPRSVRWMERLTSELARSSANGIPCRPQRLFVPAVLLRNAVFAALVLAHGLRRLAPPY
jgi:hypothetical protein